jgi:L-ascorbate metabolism protein UlaG (beta-lactamase superfamily)
MQERLMGFPQLKITDIGGPTALLEFGGLRFLTDPTFDPPGQEYKPGAKLEKIAGPALTVESIGLVDAILLSHDHHFDNLDHSGRNLLSSVPRVLTTTAGSARLGNHASGLEPWQTVSLPALGRTVTVTATPARHGPSHMDRGPVIGFALSLSDAPDEVVYISGDTVWYEGVAEVANRFPIKVALLFRGAARVPEAGPWNLTFTAEEAVLAAQAFPDATIVPLHYEGWRHFSESRAEIVRTFAAAGLERRLRWPEPGRETVILEEQSEELRPTG